ncbi:hypothetical protein V3481_004628 [Fusarium oxysporum f. sp. vasinfectum]
MRHRAALIHFLGCGLMENKRLFKQVHISSELQGIQYPNSIKPKRKQGGIKIKSDNHIAIRLTKENIFKGPRPEAPAF